MVQVRQKLKQARLRWKEEERREQYNLQAGRSKKIHKKKVGLEQKLDEITSNVRTAPRPSDSCESSSPSTASSASVDVHSGVAYDGDKVPSRMGECFPSVFRGRPMSRPGTSDSVDSDGVCGSCAADDTDADIVEGWYSWRRAEEFFCSRKHATQRECVQRQLERVCEVSGSSETRESSERARLSILRSDADGDPPRTRPGTLTRLPRSPRSPRTPSEGESRTGTTASENDARRAYLLKCQELRVVPLPLLYGSTCEVGRGVKALNLSDFGMGSRQATCLAESLREANHIAKINLDANRLGVAGLAALASALERSSSVVSLSLCGNGFGCAAGELLARLLRRRSKIQKLVLSRNGLGDDGITAIARVFKPPVDGPEVVGPEDGGEEEVGPEDGVGEKVGPEDGGGEKVGPEDGCKLPVRWGDTLPAPLSILVVSRNEIGVAGAGALERLLGHTRTLRDLDVSWNRLGCDGAEALSRGVRSNATLSRLDVSWNAVGDAGCVWLCDAVRECRGLTHLNLSNNRIGQRAAFVLSMSAPEELSRVDVSGNPIGRLGGWSMARLLRDVESVSLGSCNLELRERDAYDPTAARQQYRLDMECPFDRAVASDLVSRAREDKSGVWRNESIDGTSFRLPLYAHFELPVEGILTLRFVPSNASPSVGEPHFRRLRDLLDDSSMTEKLRNRLIRILSEYFRFTAKQVSAVMDLFSGSAERVDAVVHLYPHVSDGDPDSECLTQLTQSERFMADSRMGRLKAFYPGNPTGHYALELSKVSDRVVVSRLMEFAAAEIAAMGSRGDVPGRLWRKYRLSSDAYAGGGDTAQGEGDSDGDKRHVAQFRNAHVDGRRVCVTAGYAVPSEGKMEFDFVAMDSPAIRKRGVTKGGDVSRLAPMTAFDFDELLENMDSLSNLVKLSAMSPEEAKVEFLRSSTTDLLFSCDQVVFVMGRFGEERHRVEVAVTLFRRVVDWDQFCGVLRSERLLTDTGRANLSRRIGYLNLFNPRSPDGHYSLDLSRKDERTMAQFLAALAVREPGVNWHHVTFEGRPLELTRAWSEGRVPTGGLLVLDYRSPSWYNRPDSPPEEPRPSGPAEETAVATLSRAVKRVKLDNKTLRDLSPEEAERRREETRRHRQSAQTAVRRARAKLKMLSVIARTVGGDVLPPAEVSPEVAVKSEEPVSPEEEERRHRAARREERINAEKSRRMRFAGLADFLNS